MNAICERERLERAATYYDSRRGLAHRLVTAGAELICEHAKGPRLLELGCANGVMTEIFANRFSEVTLVEGSLEYTEEVSRRLGDKVKISHCLFEEFVPEGRYNDIVLAGVLEHVEAPVELLKQACAWLAEDGRLHIMVPNGRSLHRRLGVQMGLLNESCELNEADRSIGHRRVYDWELLQAHVKESGLRTIAKEGSFLKPLSNRQMEGWSDELLDAFGRLGSECFELCAEIYLCCVPEIQGG